MINNISHQKDELLAQCMDLNLPVNRTDSVETLKNFLQAAFDEAQIYKTEDVEDRFDLDNEPVYIGKKGFRFDYFLGRIFSIF